MNHYAMKYEAAKMTYELKLLIEKQALRTVPLKEVPSRKDSFFRPSSGSLGGKGPGDHRPPFHQGSRQHHPVCCILCGMPLADTTATEIQQQNSLMASKPTWAKVSLGTIGPIRSHQRRKSDSEKRILNVNLRSPF